jgi:uncharacterized protein involved in outer membrane biogenesis
MRKGRKIALVVLVIVVVVLVGLAVAVPLLVDVDRYRPQVVTQIEQATGKPAQIGRLALTLFPHLSIRADDFALGNSPPYPAGPLVKARRIYAVFNARALWSRQIVITSLELDDPDIRLLSDGRGNWNFESPAQPKPIKNAALAAPSFSLGVISKVLIRGGQFAAATLTSAGRAGPSFFEARGVSADLEQINLNAFIPASSPAPTIFPPVGAPTGGTRLLYAAEPKSPPAAQGTLQAESVRFSSLRADAVKSRLRLYVKQVFFDDLDLKLYGGQAKGNLSFDFGGKNVTYTADARVSGVDMARLLAEFPEAKGMMTGRMDGNIKASGEVIDSPDPLAGLRASGQVRVRNGNLPTLQLNKNLLQLARLSEIGPVGGDPGAFSSIAADFNIANSRITSNKIVVVGNGLDADGSGNLTLAGEGSLDYEGTARLLAKKNILSETLATISGATFADGKLSYPFTISGTLKNPSFRLKSFSGVGGKVGAAGRIAGAAGVKVPGVAEPSQEPQPGDVVQGIAGLFKKKKKNP